MEIHVLDGLKREGSEVNLLFYIPLGEEKLHAQFYNPENDDVIYERVINDWSQACCALLTFRHFNGEDAEEIYIRSVRCHQLIKSGVDFIKLSKGFQITLDEAIELMTDDYAFKKYFSMKNNLVESDD